MNKLIWHPWSLNKLIEKLPNVVDKIESQIDRLPEEYKDRNISAIQSFKSMPLTFDEIKNLKRTKELNNPSCYLDLKSMGSLLQL